MPNLEPEQLKADLAKAMEIGDWADAYRLADALGFDSIKRTMKRRIDEGIELVRD